jgi:EAL domain-containing protein (putative c-di-GMP-specific phosphodiesterase class I)
LYYQPNINMSSIWVHIEDAKSGRGRGVITEGVETVAHAAKLLFIECEIQQGYATARPSRQLNYLDG